MEWYYIVLIILGSAILLGILFIYIMSLYVANKVVYPHRYSRVEQNDFNKSRSYDKGVEVLERTPITFKMKDGYIINGDYSLVKESKKFCILVHGHGTSREGAVRYSLLFHDLGFSTIVYDQRSHGDNVHKDVTMGYKESQDLAEIINQVYDKFGKDIFLGIQGVSMGAATSLLALKITQNVKFVVSDCAYAALSNVVGDIVEYNHFDRHLLLPIINMHFKVLHHFSFKDVCPKEAIKENKVPILFIHGLNDKFVKSYNVDELYAACTSKKDLLKVEEAGHAESINYGREDYIKSLTKFIKEVEDN